MKLDAISPRSAFLLSFLFLTGNCYSLLFASGCGRFVWLCYLIAGLLATFVAFLLARAMHHKHDFFETLETLFSRPLGKLITLILALYAFLSIATSLSIFGRFNQLTALSQTPTVILPTLIILIGIRSCRAGIGTIARVGSFTILFVFAVFLVFSLLGINFLSPDALLPLIPNEPLGLLRGALSVFTNQLGDLLLLTVLYPHLSEKKSSRAIPLGVASTSLVLTVISLITVMTLGERGILSDSYPVFTVLSIRGVGNFIQHLEILSSVSMTLVIFFRVSLALYFIANALRHFLALPDYRAIVFPLGIFLAGITQVLYRDMLSLRTRLESDFSLAVALPLQVLLPVLIYLLSVAKRKNKHTLGSK
ncbi:MAG: hypothetical protein E7471_04745 [Ruminococcaceae bacterium]|nr:hypothetical protein [Oscillospiraceae bacterium]